jgi:flagellar basal body rod protein FlgC
MLSNVISTAANAMAVQSQRLEAIAQAIATPRTPAAPTSGAPSTPVRIGALPLGDTIENITTLAEVELAYRANASVLGTALVMIDTLLELVEPDCDCDCR